MMCTSSNFYTSIVMLIFFLCFNKKIYFLKQFLNSKVHFETSFKVKGYFVICIRLNSEIFS